LKKNKPYSFIRLCKCCDQFFIRTHNKQLYCNTTCKQYIRQDQWRDSKRRLRKTEAYKLMIQLQLGSRGTIGSTPRIIIEDDHINFEEEARIVRKQLLGIRKGVISKSDYACELGKLEEAI